MSKDTKQKKDQFTKKEKKPIAKFIGAGVVALLFVVVGFMVYSPEAERDDYFGEQVAEPRSYIGEFVSMTEVEPVITENELRLSLAEVREHSIVSFRAENDAGTMVPLMSYITPSGHLFTGSSMCEPCRGETFSLAGETLVCDVCNTTYTIEAHEFISGSTVCGSYPPVYMEPVLDGDTIIINMEDIKSWRIRAQ